MPEKIRAVLTGCGSICRSWLRALDDCPDVAIVGLVDIDPRQTEALAQEENLLKMPQSTDLDKLLQQLKPDCVFDCTVPPAHTEVALTALQHGCHVLGEKPLADSMENAQKIVSAAQQAERIHAVIQNRRYLTGMRCLRKFLDSGRIGAVTTINADFFLGAHFNGFRQKMKHVLLLDMAIHTFDQARLICGADPIAVYCHEWNPQGSWYEHDASAQCIFTMSDRIVFNYRGSWCSEGLNTAWESAWRIIGETGTVTWDGADRLIAEYVTATGGFSSKLERCEIPLQTPAGMAIGHKGVITEFIHCLKHGGTPETICSDNIKSLAMVFGAIESSETGNSVQIDTAPNI